ncbi:hypothetical protein PENSPDRAFT_568667, partial [Peniophora sp. CONT]
VISGDFCQLPPVPGPSKGMAKFAFEAQSWSRCFTTTHRLTQVFRQRDMRFVDMLGEMMIARMSPESVALIKSLARTVQYDDGIGPIELYPTKDGVAEANQRQLDDIDHPAVVFKGHERGGVDENRRPISDTFRVTILQRLGAPQELVVKKDAQVMLTMVNAFITRPPIVRRLTFPRTRSKGNWSTEPWASSKISAPSKKPSGAV